MNSRAIRRHHRERLKRLRKHYRGGLDPNDQKSLGIAIDTPRRCACDMCCNPRKRRSRNHKWEPETIQEKRAKQDRVEEE